MSQWIATVDFETRSAAILKKTGSWKYSQDPTTQVLCMAFRLPYWKKGRTALWHPAFPHLGIEEADPTDLVEAFNWIIQGELVEAHNAWFERGVWQNIMVPQYGWPAVAGDQWRCSAAKAAAHALPRGLDDAASALGLSIRKDAAGSKVMMKMNKPRKPRKAEIAAWQKEHGNAPMPLLWHESKELLDTLFAYCRQDVLTEEAVSHAVPDLSEEEQTLYTLDQTINERGFLLDMDAVNAALELIDSETSRLNAELKKLTGGSPDKATQRKKMHDWFLDQWVIIEDTKAGSVDEALKRDDLTPRVRRGLELLQSLSRSSTAKFEAMRNWACSDGRVRGGLLYHGASTGRWSGAGVQPHNFPRGTVKDIDGAWRVLKTRERSAIEAFELKKGEPVGDVLKLLSQALRGAIVAPPGKHLFVADYASIEARVLLWAAQDEAGLDKFRNGVDLYCDMAASIYGRHITKENALERQLGKTAILGLGYQMGAPKFFATCQAQGIAIDEDLAQRTVEAYREKYHRVKSLWYDQETAAGDATLDPGTTYDCFPVKWISDGNVLYCILPSGRKLAYPNPKVKAIEMSWGGKKNTLTYMGVNPKTRQWMRQSVYGGLIVENIVQAISRDVMAEAMLRCEESKIYQPILSIHDELLAEAHKDHGTVEGFVALVGQCPDWAKGCPITAEGWAGPRYRK